MSAPCEKAIFFDVGSTLLDPYPPMQSVFVKEALSRGCQINMDRLAEYAKSMDEVYYAFADQNPAMWSTDEACLLFYHTMFAEVAKECGLVVPYDDFARACFKRYSSVVELSLYDDVVDCLHFCKSAGYKLGIISNWDNRLEGLLRDFGILDFFDAVVVSAEVGCQKPDRKIFEIALERIGVQAQNAWHVGDSIVNDGAAAAVGIKPIIILRGEHLEYRDDFESYKHCAYPLISSLDQIKNIVE